MTPAGFIALVVLLWAADKVWDFWQDLRDP